MFINTYDSLTPGWDDFRLGDQPSIRLAISQLAAGSQHWFAKNMRTFLINGLDRALFAT
jgi:hypothetical protein